MPLVMTMPVGYVLFPEIKGSIDHHYIQGHKALVAQDYVKAFKSFRYCEEVFKKALKFRDLAAKEAALKPGRTVTEVERDSRE